MQPRVIQFREKLPSRKLDSQQAEMEQGKAVIIEVWWEFPVIRSWFSNNCNISRGKVHILMGFLKEFGVYGEAGGFWSHKVNYFVRTKFVSWKQCCPLLFVQSPQGWCKPWAMRWHFLGKLLPSFAGHEIRWSNKCLCIFLSLSVTFLVIKSNKNKILKY